MNQFLIKTTCSSILCVLSHWGTGKTPSHSLQYVHCALREVRAYSTTIILHLATPLYGRSLPERVALKTTNRLLRIGTWNVKTLYQAGKVNSALKEMDNMNLDLLEISECKWTDNGTRVKDDHIMIYSGGKKDKNGAAIIMRKEITRSLIGY